MCAYHCAQLLYTTQHRTVLIIFRLILQTFVMEQMLSTGGDGGVCLLLTIIRHMQPYAICNSLRQRHRLHVAVVDVQNLHERHRRRVGDFQHASAIPLLVTTVHRQHQVVWGKHNTNMIIIIIIIGKFITRTCSQAISMNRRRRQSLGG